MYNGDGKTIAIWLNVMIKMKKAMISLDKYELCTFQSLSLCSSESATCW